MILDCRECEGSGRAGRQHFGWQSDGEVHGAGACGECDGSGQAYCARCRSAVATLVIDDTAYCAACAAKDANAYADALEANLTKAFGPGWLDDVAS